MTDTRATADAAIQQAADHAEKVEPGWNERAFAAVREYAATHTGFMIEDVRVAAYEAGLPEAPTARAWGSIALRAVREGVVEKEGMAMSKVPPANTGYRAVYRSLIYRVLGALDEFHDHAYFTAAPARDGGWQVMHQPKPRRKADSVVTRSLRAPVLLTNSDMVTDPQDVAQRVADLLNKHWDHSE